MGKIENEWQDQIIDEFIDKLFNDAGISGEELRSGSRRNEVSLVRANIAIGLVKEHGVALAEVARLVYRPQPSQKP